MDFSAYQPLNRKLKTLHGAVYEDFPNAMFLLDHLLRHHVAGETVLLDAVIKDAVANRHFHRISRFAYQTYLKSIQPSPRRKIAILGALFPRLVRLTSAYCDQRGHVLCRNSLRRPDPLSLFKGGVFAPSTLLRAPLITEALGVLRDMGIDAFVEQPDLMAGLDSACNTQVARLAALIEERRIRLIISESDNWMWSRPVCEAARLVGVPYVVFAHGYVQEPTLATIAPVRGDYLMVWTQEQRRDLSAHLDPLEGSRVACLGWPKSFAEATAQRVRHGRVLFCAEPFFRFGRVGYADAIRKIAVLATSCGSKLVLRLHPKDRLYKKEIGCALKGKVRISSQRLEDAVRSSDVVLGSHSSALIEARCLGKPAVQIAELMEYRIEGCSVVRLDDVRDVIVNPQKFLADIDVRPLSESVYFSFLDQLFEASGA